MHLPRHTLCSSRGQCSIPQSHLANLHIADRRVTSMFAIFHLVMNKSRRERERERKMKCKAERESQQNCFEGKMTQHSRRWKLRFTRTVTTITFTLITRPYHLLFHTIGIWCAWDKYSLTCSESSFINNDIYIYTYIFLSFFLMTSLLSNYNCAYYCTLKSTCKERYEARDWRCTIRHLLLARFATRSDSWDRYRVLAVNFLRLRREALVSPASGSTTSPRWKKSITTHGGSRSPRRDIERQPDEIWTAWVREREKERGGWGRGKRKEREGKGETGE